MTRGSWTRTIALWASQAIRISSHKLRMARQMIKEKHRLKLILTKREVLLLKSLKIKVSSNRIQKTKILRKRIKLRKPYQLSSLICKREPKRRKNKLLVRMHPQKMPRSHRSLKGKVVNNPSQMARQQLTLFLLWPLELLPSSCLTEDRLYKTLDFTQEL